MNPSSTVTNRNIYHNYISRKFIVNCMEIKNINAIEREKVRKKEKGGRANKDTKSYG